MNIKLELTQTEADQLAQAIDVAIKQGGIPAAVALVPLFNKLKQAAEADAGKGTKPPSDAP
jgi:hypothetical protein